MMTVLACLLGALVGGGAVLLVAGWRPGPEAQRPGTRRSGLPERVRGLLRAHGLRLGLGVAGGFELKIEDREGVGLAVREG